MPEEFEQVNTNLTIEDVRMLDVLMREDGYENRSPYFRRLIRQEYARRYSQPSAVISVADAMAAGEAIAPQEG